MKYRSICYWGVSLMLFAGISVAATSDTAPKKKTVVAKAGDTTKTNTQATVTKANPDLAANAVEVPSAIVPDIVQATNDPYQRFNHHAYALNHGLDTAIIKPVTTVYHDVLPWPMRTGINNFFNNLLEVPSFFNHLLQLEFKRANATAARIVINTTLGVGGFVDVATKAKMPDYQTDFGITLAHYGARESNYLVLPILGPSTVRDMLSWPIDYYAFSVNARIKPGSIQTQMFLLRMVDNRNTLMRVEDVAQEVALDQYNFERDAYLQFRNNIINGTNLQISADNSTVATNVPSDDPNIVPAKSTSKSDAKPVQNKNDELYVLD